MHLLAAVRRIGLGCVALRIELKLRRPHVVPAGFQRNFIDPGTKHIRVVNKRTLVERDVGVRDNFVASHFLRVIINDQPDDSAEDEFGRIESIALPLIRTLRPGVQPTPDQVLATKASTAMLWARSFAREVVARRVHDQVLAELRHSAPSDTRTRARFRQTMKREPNPGEIEAMVEQQAAKILKDRLIDVDAMRRHHNDALEKFKDLHVSLYEPVGRLEFVTSDNPVLLARSNHLIQVGPHNGLALGDASFIFLPISRFVGACLTKEDEGDAVLDAMTMLRLNQAMWRNAVERIACHPALDWRRACNTGLGGGHRLVTDL